MEKVQDKISFHFKPNNVTSFRNYHHQQSPERHTNENEERFAVSPPNNARTPLLEPRRNVPTSPLLENRHPPPKPAQFKVPNSNTTRELLRNGAHRLKAIDNNLHVAPHTFLKSKKK
jgi:hypothetical protein